MRRDEWQFRYDGRELGAASKNRVDHHQARLDWWKAQKEQVLSKIREEGLEIDEKLVSRGGSMKSRDWQDSTRIKVREDLRSKFEECLNKLAYHQKKSNEYEGWLQVFASNPDARVPLDHSDWLYFFGAPNDADAGLGNDV